MITFTPKRLFTFQLTFVFLVMLSASVLAQVEPDQPDSKLIEAKNESTGVSVLVLGIAQDAGYPQAACQKNCCKPAWKDPALRRLVTSIAVVDHRSNERWIFDCSPDFPQQLRMLDEYVPSKAATGIGINGIFLTHAHIGHYTGLIHLGREVIGATEIPVHAMPRMEKFLTTNGPWSQLVTLKNIRIRGMKHEQSIQLNRRIRVTPFVVPHRDEFSETVGFKISGPGKTLVFLPDIDKWSRWDKSVEQLIKKVDFALLDGTFLANGEIPGRDMNLIPHPFITESINQFAALDESERKKVKFIHLNHTNPALRPNGTGREQIRRAGMSVARQGETIEL